MITENGRYRGRPVSAACGPASTGNMQVGVAFEIVGTGDTLTWYGSFASDKSEEIALRGLRACGWTGVDLSDFAPGKPLPAGFDREVELVIEMDWNDRRGRTEPKIKFVNDGGGLAMKNTLAGEELKAFAARMRGRLMAADRRLGTTPKQRDSDIPF